MQRIEEQNTLINSLLGLVKGIAPLGPFHGQCEWDGFSNGQLGGSHAKSILEVHFVMLALR